MSSSLSSTLVGGGGFWGLFFDDQSIKSVGEAFGLRGTLRHRPEAKCAQIPLPFQLNACCTGLVACADLSSTRAPSWSTLFDENASHGTAGASRLRSIDRVSPLGERRLPLC
ncbi:hypothetical protein CC2G_008768 [Coprinopsis cinerea AmutBmut pab1-1]|nr:hypothetical protein CC2G_008768 [Coprinopsis cinerea AmutBmut pab1-1]